MNALKTIICFFSLLTILSVSCRKQPPQLPSNKADEPDKSAETLLNINEIITNKEDSLLFQYVSTIDSVFEKSDIGFWHRISTRTDNAMLTEKSIATIAYQALSLEGTLLIDEKQTIEIGKKQIPTGLEEGLKLMRKGETGTFIVPWYLAYGMKGNETVAPYTSIVFTVKVECENNQQIEI